MLIPQHALPLISIHSMLASLGLPARILNLDATHCGMRVPKATTRIDALLPGRSLRLATRALALRRALFSRASPSQLSKL